MTEREAEGVCSFPARDVRDVKRQCQSDDNQKSADAKWAEAASDFSSPGSEGPRRGLEMCVFEGQPHRSSRAALTQPFKVCL